MQDYSTDDIYAEREWTEKALIHIARREIAKMLNEREREVLRGMGMMTLQGRVGFPTAPRDGEVRARIDYTDLSQFLKAHFNEGDHVRLLVVPEDLFGDTQNGSQ